MARKKIEKLTDEQQALFPAHVDRWTRIGLSTEKADRPCAETAIAKMYEVAGLKAPRIVWCDSPLSMALTRALLLDKNFGASVRASVWASVGASVRASVWASVRASVGDSVRASVWDSVGASVWDSVWDSVGDSVWASVGASVGDSVRASVWASVGDSVRASVWDSVGDSVWDSVGDSVWASVGASVRDSVGDSVGDSVWDSVWASVGDSVRASVWASVGASVRASVYGSHDASWLAFYDFFRQQCGLAAQTDKLSGLTELAHSAGWAIPHQHICWVSERHCVVKQDKNRRIHCENGPAISYPDGWSVYAWHGTRIPAEWIENKASLTPQIALAQANVEQRRAACEILGWATILKQLGAKTIDRDEDPEIGELIEVDLPDAGKERFIRVLCGTRREFAIPVPSTTKTALEGNAWTYDIPASLLSTKEFRT